MPFSEVVGHARPLGLLSRSIARGTLPPSLLFSGPDGVGKRLAARAVAQALNCLQPVVGTLLPIDACGRCSACARIAKGVHPDFLVLERGNSASLKIDPVREAVASTAYRPFEGRWRVVLVDEAERLVAPAQNALLKSLEEPGAASVFILVTAQPETLLPTIRSRCSRLPFGRLSAADVARVLVERHRMDQGEAHAAAAVAEGSPGRALDAGKRAFRTAREAAVSALRAAVEHRSWGSRLQAASVLAPAKSSSGGEREQLATRVRLLASLVRDVALVASGGPGQALANGDMSSEIESFAAGFNSERAIRAFAAAEKALAALRRNASPKIVAPWLIAHL